MAARGSKNAQQTRTEAERVRLHTARRTWHDGQIRRRVRDNTIAGIAGGLIVVAAFASQAVHAQVNAPEPEPTPTVTPTIAPPVTPEPTETTPAEEIPSDAPAE